MAPMNARLLRPIASRLALPSDADARAYIAAVQIADGSSLEPAVQRAIDDFVKGCKADGIFAAIKACCILMGARTLSGALTPLVGSAPTNNGPFVSGDYNRKTGLVGNASSKYLNSNRNNNADPQDSFHLSVYASALGATTDTVLAGAGGAANGSSEIIRPATGVMRLRCRTNLTSNTSASIAAGLCGMSRAASGTFSARTNGATESFSVASQSPVNENLPIFCRLSSGSPANYADARIAFYSIGESLDLALLDTRVTTLYNAIGAAIP